MEFNHVRIQDVRVNSLGSLEPQSDIWILYAYDWMTT